MVSIRPSAYSTDGLALHGITPVSGETRGLFYERALATCDQLMNLITRAGLVGFHTARILVERGERPMLSDVASSGDYVDSVVV